ncbi:hypothetical protein V494_04934 [Pseudogymnoascus sp. VKM F-4513 (FW-928)]|nr:hypothetical protein V494_04934 [Pseudogymnoascus sp. VKM F-4513 (FW-928)]
MPLPPVLEPRGGFQSPSVVSEIVTALGQGLYKWAEKMILQSMGLGRPRTPPNVRGVYPWTCQVEAEEQMMGNRNYNTSVLQLTGCGAIAPDSHTISPEVRYIGAAWACRQYLIHRAAKMPERGRVTPDDKYINKEAKERGMVNGEGTTRGQVVRIADKATAKTHVTTNGKPWGRDKDAL